MMPSPVPPPDRVASASSVAHWATTSAMTHPPPSSSSSNSSDSTTSSSSPVVSSSSSTPLLAATAPPASLSLLNSPAASLATPKYVFSFIEPKALENQSAATINNQLQVYLRSCTKAPWANRYSVCRFPLYDDFISCVLWEDRHYVTGTDIVKYVVWRFRLEGLTFAEQKKFEEGIFSDLRNLKPGTDSVLEEPRSKFLEFLFKAGCVRTHKKQKVFFWNSVPFDRLFQEALRRERRRDINPILNSLLALKENKEREEEASHHPTKRPRILMPSSTSPVASIPVITLSPPPAHPINIQSPNSAFSPITRSHTPPGSLPPKSSTSPQISPPLLPSIKELENSISSPPILPPLNIALSGLLNLKDASSTKPMSD